MRQNNCFRPLHQSNNRTIFRLNSAQDVLSLNKLIDECSKLSISIIQLPDKRLQAGLNILPLKAEYKQNPETIVIFITRLNEKNISVTSYFQGKKIETFDATNEEGIAKLIKKWLESRKSNRQDYQKRSLSLIQSITKKCEETAKQQKNELVAIQKLKSTKQYITLVEYQIQLSMQIQSISQLLMKLQQQIQDRNQSLLDKIMPIQMLKNQIEQYQYEYEETGKFFRNVKQKLCQALEKQQQKVQNMEISTQAQLNQFLTEAKLLKKIQLQKKFLL